jgi:hypothetical protein
MNPHNPTSFNVSDICGLDPHRPLPVIHPDTWRRRLYLRLLATTVESTGSLLLVFVAIGMLAVALSSGCSGSSPNTPVDAPKARAALRTALDSWKLGDAPKSLQSSPTPITVQDFDWMGGLSLVDYQIIDEGKPLDANLSVPVKLTLSGGPAKKKAHDKKVYYLVGTSPATTVFRDMFKP